MTFEVQPTKCSEPDCDAEFKPHYWGSVKSQSDGWFHQKDGRSWCPKHNPAWVAEWRARRATR